MSFTMMTLTGLLAGFNVSMKRYLRNMLWYYVIMLICGYIHRRIDICL